MSIQLYEHCVTYLYGLKPSEAVQHLNDVLEHLPTGLSPDESIIEEFGNFYTEAETCLIAGATPHDRSWINVLGSLWVEWSRTHGYPHISAWRDEPSWYVEHEDTANMLRAGWNGKRFLRKD